MGRVRLIAHRYCRARLGRFPAGAELADDVAQEVCLAVLRSLPRYRNRGRPFEAFVHGIASRKVADAQRALFRGPQTVEEIPETADESLNPEDHAVFNSQVRTANDLLNSLPRTLREVMILRVAAGLTATETGRALGMSPGAVRVAQHRAVAKMRDLVAKNADQEVNHG
jgi:RNA polymerase sigma-70 factor, ECF subfamily